jgi:hypothetical protein
MVFDNRKEICDNTSEFSSCKSTLMVRCLSRITVKSTVGQRRIRLRDVLPCGAHVSRRIIPYTEIVFEMQDSFRSCRIGSPFKAYFELNTCMEARLFILTSINDFKANIPSLIIGKGISYVESVSAIFRAFLRFTSAMTAPEQPTYSDVG